MFRKLLLGVVVVVAFVVPDQAFADWNRSNILYLSSDSRWDNSHFPDIERLSTRVHNTILRVARDGGFVIYDWDNRPTDTQNESWIRYTICFDDNSAKVVGIAFYAETWLFDNFGQGKSATRLCFIPCDVSITEIELREIFKERLKR